MNKDLLMVMVEFLKDNQPEVIQDFVEDKVGEIVYELRNSSYLDENIVEEVVTLIGEHDFTDRYSNEFEEAIDRIKSI